MLSLVFPWVNIFYYIYIGRLLSIAPELFFSLCNGFFQLATGKKVNFHKNRERNGAAPSFLPLYSGTTGSTAANLTWVNVVLKLYFWDYTYFKREVLHFCVNLKMKISPAGCWKLVSCKIHINWCHVILVYYCTTPFNRPGFKLQFCLNPENLQQCSWLETRLSNWY